MTKKFKRLIGQMLANNVTGYVIAKLLKNIVTANGLKIDISSRNISNTVKAYLFWGMYESAERRCIQKYMRYDLPVVELGASLGVITGMISRQKPPYQIAVEANPVMIPLIKNNLKVNCLTEPNIFNRAISYSGSTIVKFRLSRDSTGSSILNEFSREKKEPIIEVRSITLSDVLKSTNIRNYTLISDIEGAEGPIFYYDENAIHERCAMMIIELHETIINGKKITIEHIRNLIIKKYNFRLKAVDGAVHVFEQQDYIY